jgi:glyoxylase-like metal-dependent hydrolase (beta-lactamase superfamily II)
MKTITNDVYWVGGAELSDPADAAIYLVHSGEVGALIDAGTGRQHQKVISNIKDTGIDPHQIRYLFLTHCHYDHTGGAERLRSDTGAQVVAHREDARFLAEGDSQVTAATWYGATLLPLSVDCVVKESPKEFTIGDLSLTMYHVPGHSPGSVVLTVRSEKKLVLFGQDVHGPLHVLLRSNSDQYHRSLEFLLSLKADILCEGHFGVVYGREEVASFIESYL